jgi:Lar family restriction alleviation protein
MSELKNCPLCNGEAFAVTGDFTDFKTFIGCKSCHVSTNEYDTEAEAITAWNTRTASPCIDKWIDECGGGRKAE